VDIGGKGTCRHNDQFQGAPRRRLVQQRLWLSKA
jgi:hypothetical protein